MLGYKCKDFVEERIFEEHYAKSIRLSIRLARILHPKVLNMDKEPYLASRGGGFK